MQIISCNELKSSAIYSNNGTEASYFQVTSNVGIKVFSNPFHTSSKSHRTEESLLKSDMWERIREQFEIMKMFAKLRRGPKVYELLIAEDSGFNYIDGFSQFYPAIRMEHIDYRVVSRYQAQTFYNTPAKIRAWGKIQVAIQERFGGNDLHDTNLVYDIKENRFKVIDFGAFTPGILKPEIKLQLETSYSAKKERWRAHRLNCQKRLEEHRQAFVELKHTKLLHGTFHVVRLEVPGVKVDITATDFLIKPTIFQPMELTVARAGQGLTGKKLERKQFKEFIQTKMKMPKNNYRNRFQKGA